MQIGTIVVGILVAALGAVWLGQGVGLIKGSFMTGQSLWAWIGAILVVAGLLVVGLASRRRGPSTP